MMFWFLLLFSTNFSFSESDFSKIRDLDNKLPSYVIPSSKEKKSFSRKNKFHDKIFRITKTEDIKQSKTQLAAVKKGSILHHIEDNEQKIVPKDIYVRVFDLEDENGFKFIQNEDGTITWKIPGRMIESLKEDLKMFESPEIYTPAPVISKSFFDQKINLLPELILYSGIINGKYMQDLFNDNKASRGVTNQYGLNLASKWSSPVKAGGVIHFEKSNFSSGTGDYIIYSSLSLGPQIKSKDFDLGFPVRIQTQFRIGPFASASSKNNSYKFYSNDFMLSMETPSKNVLGEFVFGIYFQKQWLNLKNQSTPINLESDNKSNDSYGISISQVFE
jgi:hypothetical protein